MSLEIFDEYKKFLEILKNYNTLKGCPLIIVRPHPAEDIDAWFKFSKEVSNVKVVYEGETTPWINASSGVLHRGCSAAIQAHMRGLPVGHFIVKNAKKEETPYNISSHLYTIEDLVGFCRYSVANKDKTKIEYHQEFKKMIYIKDDELASELIVKDLFQLETNKENSIEKNIKNNFIDIIIYLRATIKRVLQFFLVIRENLGVLPLSRKIPGGIKKVRLKNFYI